MWNPAGRLWKIARISDALEPRVAATARFTVGVAVITCIGVIIYCASSLLLTPAPAVTYAAAGAYLAGALAAFLLVRLGHIPLAAHVIVLASWSAGTFFVLTEGPQTRHLGIYFIAIIAAGLLTRPLAAILYGAASAITLVVVNLMVERGHDASAAIPDGAWTNTVFQLFVAGGLTALLVHGLQRVLADLSESEQRRAALVNNSPDGIVLLDADGRCVEINSSGLALLGLDTDPREPAVDVTVLRAIGFDPDAFEDGAWVATIDVAGEARVLEVNAIRWRGREDAAFGFELILRDITARERDHSERRRLQANLLRSQKTEALGRLAGGVAHDFNNLLTVILANASPDITENTVDQRERERLEEIYEAGEKAADITRQLLIFGSKASGQVRTVDVRDVVQGIVRMSRRLLGERIALEISLAEAPLMVRADPVLLEQVLVNLVVNAHDAMPTGGELSIEAHPTADGEWALLRVTDSGTGMTDEERQHAFEPFFSTKPEGQGTGLGLSTAALIVTELGGEIGIESVLGEGSTLTARLPRHDVEGLEEAPARDEPARRAGRNRLVCVVDDDRGVLRVVERILKANAYRIIAGYEWEEVEALLVDESTVPSLLVTDVVLQGSSGVDVARAFRARCGDRPVLFMSGYAGRVLESYGMDEQVELMNKPFSARELLGQVERLLDQEALR